MGSTVELLYIHTWWQQDSLKCLEQTPRHPEWCLPEGTRWPLDVGLLKYSEPKLIRIHLSNPKPKAKEMTSKNAHAHQINDRPKLVVLLGSVYFNLAAKQRDHGQSWKQDGDERSATAFTNPHWPKSQAIQISKGCKGSYGNMKCQKQWTWPLWVQQLEPSTNACPANARRSYMNTSII